jgi:hypothetical protein
MLTHNERRFLVIIGLLSVAIVVIFAGLAHGHDWKRPDLDSWYAGLQNPRSGLAAVRNMGCCSKDDCHETEAEQRGADWWARLGTRVRAADGQHTDWVPGPWVKVPPDAILEQHDNPTGNAVICHSMAMNQDGSINPAANTVFCFIRPTES